MPKPKVKDRNHLKDRMFIVLIICLVLIIDSANCQKQRLPASVSPKLRPGLLFIPGGPPNRRSGEYLTDSSSALQSAL